MDEIEPKFGELLRGIYASESNPRRDGMYVRTIIRRGRMNPGKFYELTDGNGNFWVYLAQSVERIASALRSAQVPEWRPIETAPKDGTPVLVTFNAGDIGGESPGVMVARWDAYYAEGGNGWDGACDGWADVHAGEGCHLHYGFPTHWMPLPAAPSAEGAPHA